MGFVLRDVRSGLIFNRRDYRLPGAVGVWMTTTAWAPCFDTAAEVRAFGAALGARVGTFEAAEVCSRCHGTKPAGQSCGCFDNGCE